MNVNPHGIHHVTAIASDPQANVDFYTKVLGLRLVKQTVNFDAPHVWHLYYGDAKGSPASILTFFPWPGVMPGREGAGLTTATAFSVPPESIGFWHERAKQLSVSVEAPVVRGDSEVLTIFDNDGMRLELIASEGDARSGWDGVSDIPAEMAVRGLHAVTLSERNLDPTSSMLTDLLGMELGIRAIRGRNIQHGDWRCRCFRGCSWGSSGPRSASRWNCSPCRLQGARSCNYGELAARTSWERCRCHRGNGPPIFQEHIFPRTGRCAV
jgi:catechol 2,3-dioxygenase-like lactoylglutathione lyase family enzyme